MFIARKYHQVQSAEMCSSPFLGTLRIKVACSLVLKSHFFFLAFKVIHRCVVMRGKNNPADDMTQTVSIKKKKKEKYAFLHVATVCGNHRLHTPTLLNESVWQCHSLVMIERDVNHLISCLMRKLGHDGRWQWKDCVTAGLLMQYPMENLQKCDSLRYMGTQRQPSALLRTFWRGFTHPFLSSRVPDQKFVQFISTWHRFGKEWCPVGENTFENQKSKVLLLLIALFMYLQLFCAKYTFETAKSLFLDVRTVSWLWWSVRNADSFISFPPQRWNHASTHGCETS